MLGDHNAVANTCVLVFLLEPEGGRATYGVAGDCADPVRPIPAATQPRSRLSLIP